MFRLFDPNNLVNSIQLDKLRTKLDKAMTKLVSSSVNGGNPFLYCLLAGARHELADKMPTLPNWKTAATDGEKYYWHPDFLDNLKPHEIPIVLQHESIHVLADHVKKFTGKDPSLFAYCIDFCANGHIEADYRKSKRYLKAKKNYGLWGGSFGTIVTIETLIKALQGKTKLPNGKIVFVDIEAVKLSPESLYEKIRPYWFSSNTKCKECGMPTFPLFGKSVNNKSDDMCKTCGKPYGECGKYDGHLPIKKNKQEITEEIIRAGEQANQIEKGSVPAYVEEFIGNLLSPTVNLADYIRMQLLNKSNQGGRRNDWKRPKRRSVALGYFLPRRKSLKSKWLSMLDTSGSMSDKSIIYGLSQLQSLGDETDGIIVPCDAIVHWDHMVEVKKAGDIARVKVIGRGGTVFDSFFTEYEKQAGTDFDIIIIITDGLLPPLRFSLKPPIDVLWAVINNQTFRPNFGRVIKLKI